MQRSGRTSRALPLYPVTKLIDHRQSPGLQHAEKGLFQTVERPFPLLLGLFSLLLQVTQHGTELIDDARRVGELGRASIESKASVHHAEVQP
jgi:hypothetical protein